MGSKSAPKKPIEVATIRQRIDLVHIQCRLGPYWVVLLLPIWTNYQARNLTENTTLGIAPKINHHIRWGGQGRCSSRGSSIALRQKLSAEIMDLKVLGKPSNFQGTSFSGVKIVKSHEFLQISWNWGMSPFLGQILFDPFWLC